MRPKPINIIIYRTGRIGDVILSTVSLSLLSQATDQVAIYWIGRFPTLALICAAYPDVVPVDIPKGQTYSKNLHNILRTIKKADVLIDLQRTPRSIILCGIASLKLGATYTTWNKGSIKRSMMVILSFLKGRKGNVTHTLSAPRNRRFELIANCVKKSISSLKITLNKNSSPWLPEVKIPIQYFLTTDGEKRYIAVGAGALYESKWAPAQKIADILNQIHLSALSLGVIFLGDTKDNAPSLEVIKKIHKEYEIINLCGKTNLIEAGEILRHCTVLLSNDTSLIHLAEAVDTPVAALFGPTVEAFGFAPFLPKSKVFSTHLGCRPCSKSGNAPCRYKGKLCFSQIKAHEVSSFLTQTLMPLVLKKT